jgi:hypothetical protein
VATGAFEMSQVLENGGCGDVMMDFLSTRGEGVSLTATGKIFPHRIQKRSQPESRDERPCTT